MTRVSDPHSCFLAVIVFPFKIKGHTPLHNSPLTGDNYPV